jgi:hypothetical protein
VLDSDSELDLIYHYGVSPVSSLVKRGRLLF